jgi:hypothetical protein
MDRKKLAGLCFGYLVAVAIAIAGHATGLPFGLQTTFVGVGGFAAMILYLNYDA